MTDVVRKTLNSIRAIGVIPTGARIVGYLHFLVINRPLRVRTQALLASGTAEERFTRIYRENYWGSAESASGEGSTHQYTQSVRKHLPQLLRDFSIRSMFDAPCGDFHWMRLALEGSDIDYVGGDIVAPLIDDLKAKHEGPRRRFQHVDITTAAFPDVDLWFCRDCLFHLSYADTRKALQRFVDSNARYLLTSTHINATGAFINTDIRTGDFRRIDLFSKPYRLPADVLARFEDWAAPERPREMCLWTREQVRQALASTSSLAAA